MCVSFIYEAVSSVSALKTPAPLIVSVSTQLPWDVTADADYSCDMAALLSDATKFTPY